MTPIGTSHRVISRDGTRIAYLTVGTGPAVLVIPGVLSMAADYAACARALAEHSMKASKGVDDRLSHAFRMRESLPAGAPNDP